MQADSKCRPIQKTRYCLAYEAQYFEIDIYLFWKDKAIVELELRSEEEEIHFPDFLKEIKEQLTYDHTWWKSISKERMPVTQKCNTISQTICTGRKI